MPAGATDEDTASSLIESTEAGRTTWKANTWAHDGAATGWRGYGPRRKEFELSEVDYHRDDLSPPPELAKISDGGRTPLPTDDRVWGLVELVRRVAR